MLDRKAAERNISNQTSKQKAACNRGAFSNLRRNGIDVLPFHAKNVDLCRPFVDVLTT